MGKRKQTNWPTTAAIGRIAAASLVAPFPHAVNIKGEPRVIVLTDYPHGDCLNVVCV